MFCGAFFIVKAINRVAKFFEHESDATRTPILSSKRITWALQFFKPIMIDL